MKFDMKRTSSNESIYSVSSDFSDSDRSQKSVEKKMYYLYNSSNIYIDASFINNLLKENGIHQTVNDLSLWQKAFVHKSYAKNGEIKKKKDDKYIDIHETVPEGTIPLQDESNERLEWLGDGVLQNVIGMYLFERFKTQDEGFLTKMRSKLVKTESLAKLSQYLGLEPYIMMSHHVEVNCNGRKNSRILEDTFESFIGSMWKDLGIHNNSLGYDICSKFIVNVIENAIDITELILHDDNYKDQLMRYCQKKFSGYFPKYIQQNINNIENENGTVIKRFKMGVLDHNGIIIGNGIARSKKEAEQKAAKDALNKYGLINGY